MYLLWLLIIIDCYRYWLLLIIIDCYWFLLIIIGYYWLLLILLYIHMIVCICVESRQMMGQWWMWWNIMAGHRSVDACTCAKGFKLKPSDSEIWGGHPLVKKQDLLGDLRTNRNESGAEQQTNQHHVYQSHQFYLWRGVKWLHRFHITFLLGYIPCESLRNSGTDGKLRLLWCFQWHENPNHETRRGLL